MKVDPTTNIPTSSSKSEDWVNWYDELESNFGSSQAKALFLKAWKLRGNQNANDLNLRTYLKNKGVVISESGWDKIVDTGAGVFDGISDMFHMGKYAAIAIGGTIIVITGILVYNIVKNPNKAIGTAIKYVK